MKPDDLIYFEKLLTEQLSELLGQAGNTMSGLLNGEDSLADPLDIATFESQRSTLLRIRDRESKLIRKIHSALNRIKEGTFGTCEICGEDIGLSRLNARPVTTLCIQCKTWMEAQEKKFG
jgi:DnaK suppressor protein